jgi:hypothetical protein
MVLLLLSLILRLNTENMVMLQMDLRVLQALKAPMVLLGLPVPEDLLVPKDFLGKLEIMEKLALQDLREIQEYQDPVGLKGFQVPLDQKALLARRDRADPQAELALGAPLVPMVKQALQDPRDLLANLARKALKEKQALMELMVALVWQALVDNLEKQARKALRELTGTLDPTEELAALVLKAPLVLLEQQVMVGVMASQVQPDQQVP